MFRLSAELRGHEDDVRGVAFPHPSSVLSASRDATVRLWKQQSSNPPSFEGTIVSQGSSFINSLAYVTPSKEYPEGLIVSGGREAIIDVRQPSRLAHDNADGLLLGHSANVCALNVSEDGRTIVSGGWDAEARVWQVGRWEAAAVLREHQGSVWAVLAYDRETIITGCADKLIRIFHPSGKLLRTISGSSDVVRALCKLPAQHPSGAQFASAGNDATIRLWTLGGSQVAKLYGHENFIYSLAVLSSGELVSSGEDRTVRIWKGHECVQTITHPAISVWAVAANAESGDIISGASDRVVRVFSRAKDRQASDHAVAAFEESVRMSSIPQQSVGGNINKEKLPGPEFISQKSGTKEGQVQMIREANGSVSAYQWSTATNEWLNVGTVVDAAGSSGRKISYQGKDYDYVFDVDIEDGKPPLKLPYNLSENPYERATKFIQDNELPISYLDQVTNFIVSNTQGASLGQSSQTDTQPPGSDPWGTESRYRPGEVGTPTSAPQTQQSLPQQQPRTLPQTEFLSIATANHKVIQRKIEQFNKEFLEQGSKDLALNPTDIEALGALIKQLEVAAGKPLAQSSKLTYGIDIALKVGLKWPADKRLPGLDLLRLLAAASSDLVTRSSSGPDTLVDLFASASIFAPDAPLNNVMLAVRCLGNLFSNEAGKLIADGEFEKIHTLIEPFVDRALQASNANLIVAITTLYINYAVQLRSPASSNADRAMTLLQDLTAIIEQAADAEALYRALVGAGTLLSLGADFRSLAKEAFDFDKALERAAKVGSEPRIKGVIEEMRDELK